MVLGMDALDVPPANYVGGTAAPTMSQDQAVIGWLATRPDLPALTCDLLLDVLIVWDSFAPLPSMTAEPRGGSDVHVSDLLHAIDQRMLQHPCHADDLQAQIAIDDIHCLLGLARYSLLDPDGAGLGRERMEEHLSWFVQVRARETDFAVDLALAELRRQRSAWSRARVLARARASTPHRRWGPGRPRSGRSGPQSHNLLGSPLRRPTRVSPTRTTVLRVVRWPRRGVAVLVCPTVLVAPMGARALPWTAHRTPRPSSWPRRLCRRRNGRSRPPGSRNWLRSKRRALPWWR